jgi:hypothetical protein
VLLSEENRPLEIHVDHMEWEYLTRECLDREFLKYEVPQWGIRYIPWNSGDFTAPGRRAAYALIVLTQIYRANQKFMDGLAEIHSQNADAIHFIQAEKRELRFPVPGNIDSLKNLGLVPCHPQSKDLVGITEGFGKQWGLNAPWATGLLLQNLTYGHRCERGLAAVWKPTFWPTLALSWESVHKTIAPPGGWDPVTEKWEHYLNRMKKYRADVERKAKELGIESQRGKSELDTYVGWLYERIALKLTPTQICDKQGNSPHPVGQATIERGIAQVARLLEITLPLNRSRYVR